MVVHSNELKLFYLTILLVSESVNVVSSDQPGKTSELWLICLFGQTDIKKYLFHNLKKIRIIPVYESTKLKPDNYISGLDTTVGHKTASCGL